MSAPSLEELVKSLPSVLSREEAFAAFDTLLMRAEADTEESTKMAEALGEVLFHFSDSYSDLSVERETRLRLWIEGHWRTEPVQAFGALFNLLANMLSDEVTRLLEAKRPGETNPEVLGLIDECLAERAAALARNRRLEEEAAAEKAGDEARAARAAATSEAARAAEAEEARVTAEAQAETAARAAAEAALVAAESAGVAGATSEAAEEPRPATGETPEPGVETPATSSEKPEAG